MSSHWDMTGNDLHIYKQPHDVWKRLNMGYTHKVAILSGNIRIQHQSVRIPIRKLYRHFS